MRRFLLPALLAILVWTPSAASAQVMQDSKMRVIGRAMVEVTPDLVTVLVGITNKAPTPTAALDQNSAVALKIIGFSKQFGIGDSDIQTDAINLNPAFKTVRGPNGDSRQEPDGYNAANTVRVRLRDVTRLGAYMRQVLDQGANRINGVQFGLSNPEKAADDARVKAVEDAVRQAGRLAAAAQVKLGSITEIVHPPRAQSEPVMNMYAPAKRRTDVPVEAGALEIAAEVEITWKIE